MSSRLHAGRARFGCFSIALLLGVIAACLAPASALGAYVLKASFGSPGSGDGQLELVAPDLLVTGTAGSGLAVNDTTHDVYVADTTNHRVDQCASSGVPA